MFYFYFILTSSVLQQRTFLAAVVSATFRLTSINPQSGSPRGRMISAADWRFTLLNAQMTQNATAACLHVVLILITAARQEIQSRSTLKLLWGN